MDRSQLYAAITADAGTHHISISPEVDQLFTEFFRGASAHPGYDEMLSEGGNLMLALLQTAETRQFRLPLGLYGIIQQRLGVTGSEINRIQAQLLHKGSYR